MTRPVLVSGLLAALLAVGCTKPPEVLPQSQPSQKQVAGSEVPAIAPTSASSAAEPAPAPSDFRTVVTVAPASALVHLRFQPGQMIDRPGIFFMNTGTGAVEGWTNSDGEWASYSSSRDGRWVTVTKDKLDYLVDRKSSTVFQWDSNNGTVLAAEGDYMLIQSGKRLWLGRGGPKTAVELELLVDKPKVVGSPDGRSFVILDANKVYLVDAEKGVLHKIGEFSGIDPKSPVQLGTGRRTHEAFVVAYQPDFRGLIGIQRYGWDGTRLSDSGEFGWGDLSPDGRLAAQTIDVEGLSPITTVFDVMTRKPVFRVLGAALCSERTSSDTFWLADGSGLVVQTRDGHRLVQANGLLAESPTFPGTSSFAEVVPSPAAPNLFAIGRKKVVDGSGKQIATANIQPDLIVNTSWVWGYQNDEIKFVLLQTGYGSRCGDILLPVQVERPPFADHPTLAVNVQSGDCVNLRAEPKRDGAVIACLPGGTRLSSATPPGRISNGKTVEQPNPTGGVNGDPWWWFAQTQDGRQGWVAVSGEYLTWAPSGH